MRGSEGDVYDVEAERHGDMINITCTCEAGQRGIHCHHRLELIHGDVTALESKNVADVKKLATLIKGTKLADALAALTAAEAAEAAAKAQRHHRMKTIDRLMRGEDVDANGAPV